jgi:hypothetical protein
MKIYRIRDIHHNIRTATSDDGAKFYALSGDISCHEFKITNERIDVLDICAPVEPRTIYAIGLN